VKSAPDWYDHELEVGDRHRSVAVVQRKLGIPITGIYDQTTAAVVRGFQMARKLKKTGTVNVPTAASLGDRATRGLTPEWWRRPLQLWDTGDDCKALNAALNLPPTDRFTPDTEAAIRRYQSSNNLPVTGMCHEEIAKMLGDL